MPIAFVRLAGTLVWPLELIPQATTVPFVLSASAWPPPAAIATTLVRPAGTFVGLPLLPQATRVLLLRRARQKLVPAAMATMFVRLAGIVPKFVPQFVTEPLLSK